MGALIGFAVGYVFGMRKGPEGFDELRESWETISSSEEVRDLVSGGASILRDLLLRRRSVIADRLQPAGEELSRVA